ncbi:hypothetical protein N7359_01870 [Stenotrophomonas maltophilia]|uniref:hypothetical protein n=1 Tax=Stenotrophomonas maltophilia TaxID=40324 RepID=UPI00244980CF|nr:hypothetical protein [Stenotrophomonas maltophilia]MDH0071289.1 hypothetical protein [Stenotrophomonas maltophilia]MDH0104114.1 hypothetical protein [Stenotrophomonas maltophilia]MDH0330237.1 hypothetical protein [Stenotrophomonas maltophilia]
MASNRSGQDQDGLFAEIAEELQVTGVSLSASQARELVADDDELLEMIEEWGADDTELLSQLANLLSQQLLGETWPTFGDASRPGADTFQERFEAAAKAHGYALVGASNGKSGE